MLFLLRMQNQGMPPQPTDSVRRQRGADRSSPSLSKDLRASERAFLRPSRSIFSCPRDHRTGRRVRRGLSGAPTTVREEGPMVRSSDEAPRPAGPRRVKLSRVSGPPGFASWPRHLSSKSLRIQCLLCRCFGTESPSTRLALRLRQTTKRSRPPPWTQQGSVSRRSPSRPSLNILALIIRGHSRPDGFWMSSWKRF